jgi:hypothetical protein
MKNSLGLERPDRTVTKWGKGKLPTAWFPGDVGIVEYEGHNDLIDSMIQARERVTCGNTAWANVDHAFCVVDPGGGIVEANEGGIEPGNGEKYRDRVFWIISPKVPQNQRDLCVEFWLSRVGAEYGYLDFIFTQAPKAIFGVSLGIHASWQEICSELACNGQLKYLIKFQEDSSEMTPADMLMFWDVDMGEPPAPLGWRARMWNVVIFVGHLIAKPFRKGP